MHTLQAYPEGVPCCLISIGEIATNELAWPSHRFEERASRNSLSPSSVMRGTKCVPDSSNVLYIESPFFSGCGGNRLPVYHYEARRAFEEASPPTQPPRLISRLDEACGNHLKIRNLRH